MVNATAEDVSKGYGVRRGSSFVNEYARVNAAGQQMDGGLEDTHHTMGCYPWLWPYAMGGIETDRPIRVRWCKVERYTSLYISHKQLQQKELMDGIHSVKTRTNFLE